MLTHLKNGGVRTTRGHRPRSLLTQAQWRCIAASLNLSGRALQIIQSIFDGRKEAAIAHQLGISTHTVHTHVERLYRKLAVGSRCELLIRIFATHLALESGQATPQPPTSRSAVRT